MTFDWTCVYFLKIRFQYCVELYCELRFVELKNKKIFKLEKYLLFRLSDC